ncbi:hypothetical protein L3X38_025478 [Prunus dulcis]|uniref:Reverse transcriptase RNase H-like domain-containing protein n=1 Tax=Prunus dulcis TaxID=3755 RepID=A0AAD4W1U3_PRUDU|nr:hypothetical protein L3X38_025478 [Prunus dulcis]
MKGPAPNFPKPEANPVEIPDITLMSGPLLKLYPFSQNGIRRREIYGGEVWTTPAASSPFSGETTAAGGGSQLGLEEDDTSGLEEDDTPVILAPVPSSHRISARSFSGSFQINAMADWPIPTSVKSLGGFLGLTGYYRKFIPHYGRESFPLTQLMKNDGFLWMPEAIAAFHKLKELMLSPRVLALLDFTKPFIIESDASGTGIGVGLQQEGRPISFTSKTLGPRNQALSTYEREMMAIVHAIKKWHHYLQGRHFVIQTGHHNLKYFFNHKAHIPFQQKWVTKLLGYDYEIQYEQCIVLISYQSHLYH